MFVTCFKLGGGWGRGSWSTKLLRLGLQELMLIVNVKLACLEATLIDNQCEAYLLTGDVDG